MVNGLNTFKSWFTDYQDNYIIIGGTACDAVLTDAGLTPRATKDIDIILIFEALTKEFVSHFWEFVKEAGFRRCEQEIEKHNAYRFLDPADTRFPKQVELFCRMPDALTLPSDLHITPIPVEEGLSSLSAILLNDEYYHFTLNHSYFDDGIHFANIEALICLKAYAFLSNLKLKESGVEIHSVNIEKHKNDVFRLLPLLPQNTTIELGKDMLADMKKFASTIEAQLPDNKMLKDAGYVELTSETLYQNLVSIFQLDKPLP
jgi:hypothetical protein